MGRKLEANIIFRAHLNSGDSLKGFKYEFLKIMPYAKYPAIDEFLYIADVLITDWSSIAIDFLPLSRPAIFLDVPAPFAKGFTLGPEHRYGLVVKSIEELKSSIEEGVLNPEEFLNRHKEKMNNTKELAYGHTLDGRARERYMNNLNDLIDSR